MDGEGPRQDYKLTYDPTDREARLRLVKDIIAFANAGGGAIIFGRDETAVYGVDEEVVRALDSARLADDVDKFTRPATIDLSHTTQQLAQGRCVVTVHIAAAGEYPIVIAEDGNCPGTAPGKTKHVFAKGDIWTRHSSKTERATRDDLRAWIDRARRTERDAILGRINKVIDLPDGAEIQILPPAAVPALDTPQRMLEYETKRRAQKGSHVMPGDDLLHLFIHRADLQDGLTEDTLSLILASALRRPTTLFWWLPRLENNRELILPELHQCLHSADRDKSDAASSVIELAAIYADDEQLAAVVTELQSSRYKHFREAAQAWNGRGAQLARLSERIQRAKYKHHPLDDLEIEELERCATEAAVHCSGKGSTQARQLGDITRVIWSRRSDYARKLIYP